MDDYSDNSSDFSGPFTNLKIVDKSKSNLSSIKKKPSSLAGSAIDADDLCWPSAGTKLRKLETKEDTGKRLEKMAGAVQTLLECIGEDVDREGLARTPLRYAKALMFFTKGYEQSISEIVNEAVFEEDYDDMIIVKDIAIHSLCEHHLVPFTGKV